MLSLKRILVCVTGGIAAYKAVEFIRLLRLDDGVEVRVTMSVNAHKFIGETSLQAVSGNIVRTSLFDAQHEAAMGHIELARWADAVVIVPASANIIAKLAHGMADCLISTLCLASNAPIYVAPAMNTYMWNSAVTQKNVHSLETLEQYKIIGPVNGLQACGDNGFGRMCEPNDIKQFIENNSVIQKEEKPKEANQSEKILQGLKVLITAGPTVEAIDPVRFISNRSSGKMGYALAEACVLAGAQVTLISGPVSLCAHKSVQLIKVTTGIEMYNATLQIAADFDIYIATAAVADYKPLMQYKEKIKRKVSELNIACIQNPDITRAVTALKAKPFSVGFAAETESLKAHAKHKLKYKGLDMLVANDVSNPKIGFDSSYNEVWVFGADQEIKLPIAEKSVISQQLLTIIAKRYYEISSTKNSRSQVRQQDPTT